MITFKPHGYQTRSINWVLDKPKCGLFLDMGLGKTVSTLTAIDEIMYNRYDIEKVLVIAPKRVAESTWPDEVKKWKHLNHLRINVISGDKVTEAERKRRTALRADIHVIGRDNVVWLANYLGKRWDYDMVVIDELSSFKSEGSKRFKALRKVISYSSRVVGLTGTPAPNGLLDLWAQIYLLDGGQRLGRTFTQYRDRFFVPASYIRDSRGNSRVNQYLPRAGATKEIWDLISDICISMMASEYLDLPPAIENPVKVKLSRKAKQMYDHLEKKLLLAVDTSLIIADTAAALSNKLMQAASGAAYDEAGNPQIIHTDMIDALKELLEATDGNVLVFYNFKHDLTQIQKYFPHAVVLKTKEDQDDWNAGKIPLLLAHPASAGHGLNLQAGGHNTIWFGLTWNLELFQQANKRLDRQGQQRRVTNSFLIPEDTIVEEVFLRLKGKAATQDSLMDALSVRKNKYVKLD